MTHRLAATALALVLLVPGCRDGSSPGAVSSFDPSLGGPAAGTESAPAVQGPGDPAPRRYQLTAEGVHLFYPAWLDHHATRKAELLEELRTATPEADARIDADVRGVPAGVTVIVLDPGAYYAPYSPTLLATGEWRFPSTIYVAWRGASTGPLVPALPHELRHLLTGDPFAGH